MDDPAPLLRLSIYLTLIPSLIIHVQSKVETENSRRNIRRIEKYVVIPLHIHTYRYCIWMNQNEIVRHEDSSCDTNTTHFRLRVQTPSTVGVGRVWSLDV
jgi:hypothetical protein